MASAAVPFVIFREGANPSVKNYVFATSPVRGGKWVCKILTWLP